MEKYQEIERELIKTHRKNIWSKFVKAICDYDMIKDGDKIAVCISGGKDSALMAKCFQELKKHRKKDFDLEFIVIDDNDNNGVDKSLVRFGDNLIVCDGNRGFTEVEFKQAEEILSRENRYRVKNVEDEQK